jgi:hypothetical protein
MASHRQIRANQRNALRSTGPRSDAGKARSRLNAMQHGLTARHVLLPGEDPREFEAFRRAAFDRLLPEGEVEKQLADRVVTLLWRMRRIPLFEIALWEWTAQWHGVDLYDGDGETDLDQDPDEAATDSQATNDRKDHVRLGRVLEVLLNKDFSGKLSRYEMSLQKQLAMTLKELRELAATRPDENGGSPRQSNRNPEPLPRVRLLRRGMDVKE